MRFVLTVLSVLATAACSYAPRKVVDVVSCSVSIAGRFGDVSCSDGRHGQVERLADGTYSGEVGMSSRELFAGNGASSSKSVIVAKDRTDKISANPSCDVGASEIFCQ